MRFCEELHGLMEDLPGIPSGWSVWCMQVVMGRPELQLVYMDRSLDLLRTARISRSPNGWSLEGRVLGCRPLGVLRGSSEDNPFWYCQQDLDDQELLVGLRRLASVKCYTEEEHREYRQLAESHGGASA